MDFVAPIPFLQRLATSTSAHADRYSPYPYPNAVASSSRLLEPIELKSTVGHSRPPAASSHPSSSSSFFDRLPWISLMDTASPASVHPADVADLALLSRRTSTASVSRAPSSSSGRRRKSSASTRGRSSIRPPSADVLVVVNSAEDVDVCSYPPLRRSSRQRRKSVRGPTTIAAAAASTLRSDRTTRATDSLAFPVSSSPLAAMTVVPSFHHTPRTPMSPVPSSSSSSAAAVWRCAGGGGRGRRPLDPFRVTFDGLHPVLC